MEETAGRLVGGLLCMIGLSGQHLAAEEARDPLLGEHVEIEVGERVKAGLRPSLAELEA